jgi:hypothetical protein
MKRYIEIVYDNSGSMNDRVSGQLKRRQMHNKHNKTKLR